jgi:hypothetical protein
MSPPAVCEQRARTSFLHRAVRGAKDISPVSLRSAQAKGNCSAIRPSIDGAQTSVTYGVRAGKAGAREDRLTDIGLKSSKRSAQHPEKIGAGRCRRGLNRRSELLIQPSAPTRMTYREILDLDPEAPVLPAPPRTAVYPLVGRHPEWHTLLNAWRAAAAGRPRLFLIRGEAGIGKTRLAEELIDWCSLQSISAVTARCYAGEGRWRTRRSPPG